MATIARVGQIPWGTACSGADCFLEVQEASGTSCTNSDGDTSYIEASANGAAQTFDLNLSHIPDNATITQIDITVCQKRIGTSPGNKFQTRWCTDGVCANSGADLGASGAYTENTQSYTRFSVTKLSSTDLEVGVAITGTNAKTVRVSQISAVITYTTPTPISSSATPSTSGSSGAVAPTSVFVTGQVYPGSKIEFLRKSIQEKIFHYIPDATSTISADGAFQIRIIGLLGGEYLFALRAEDKEGRKTGIIGFNADLSGIGASLQAKDILMPPTADFEHALISLGKEIKIKGYAAPEKKISIEIDGIFKGETTSDINGYWSYATSTAPFRIGDHYARAKQIDARSKMSEFSTSRTFRVSLLASPKADFNNDNKVTITDWSIFLFRWGSMDKTLRTKIDMNDDGKIDISDFSIFLKAMQI